MNLGRAGGPGFWRGGDGGPRFCRPPGMAENLLPPRGRNSAPSGAARLVSAGSTHVQLGARGAGASFSEIKKTSRWGLGALDPGRSTPLFGRWAGPIRSDWGGQAGPPFPRSCHPAAGGPGIVVQIGFIVLHRGNRGRTCQLGARLRGWGDATNGGKRCSGWPPEGNEWPPTSSHPGGRNRRRVGRPHPGWAACVGRSRGGRTKAGRFPGKKKRGRWAAALVPRGGGGGYTRPTMEHRLGGLPRRGFSWALRRWEAAGKKAGPPEW